MAVDNSQPRKLATLLREPIQKRLADVGNARRHIELLAKSREAHREAIEARIRILFGPSKVHQRREQAVSAALRKRKSLGDFSQRHAAGAVRKQLDDC